MLFSGFFAAMRDLVTSIRDLTATFREANEALHAGQPATLPAALAERVEAAAPVLAEVPATNGEAVPEEVATPRRRRAS